MNTDEVFQDSRAFQAIREIFQGGRPLVFICTPEEGRVRSLLLHAAKHLFPHRIPVWNWSLTLGLQPEEGGRL